MPFKRILLYVWISLLLIVAVFILLRNGKPSSDLIREVELPGKAKMVLYRSATMDKAEDEEGRELMTVTGKVYIEIPAQEDITFSIQTSEAMIEMTSGAAVIDASVDRTTELIVSSGQASLLPLSLPEDRRRRKVQVLPGEKCIISPYARGVVKQNNRDANFMSWVDFKFTFDNERLEDIILSLQDVYGIEILLATPNLSRCRYTGIFDQLALKNIIDRLAEEFSLQVTQNEDGSWQLVGEGC